MSSCRPGTHWGTRLQLPRPDDALGDAGLLSAAVLKIHEDRAYPGAVVASLSVPWGNSTDTLGGYHLVWPRDATLTAFALLAANQLIDARHILAHLTATQRRDGRWPQNYFPSGEPFWIGVQLDEAAFPVLLAAKLRELGEAELPGTRADGARGGRIHRADRSFQSAGSMGGEPGRQSIHARRRDQRAGRGRAVADRRRARLRAGSLADDWNERLEVWCYVCDTELARAIGVRGYYVRIGTPGQDADADRHRCSCAIATASRSWPRRW